MNIWNISKYGKIIPDLFKVPGISGSGLMSGGASIMLTANQRWGAGMLLQVDPLGSAGAAHSSVAATEPSWAGSSADPDSRLLIRTLVG